VTLRLLVSALFVVFAALLSPNTRARTAIGAALAAALTFLWLFARNSEDGGRGHDWGCAYVTIWDCLRFNQCFTAGAGSSVRLANGAVWPHLETFAAWLGPGGALKALVVALCAAAVGVVFAAVARRGAPAYAWAFAAGLVAWIAGTIDRTLLDANATFPFAVLGQAALAIFALERRREALVAASLLLAIAGNMHTSALTGAVALGIVTIAASRRPLWDVLLAAGLWLLTTLLTSKTALYQNEYLITQELPHGGTLASGVLLGVVGLGLFARSRWEAASNGARLGVVGAAVLVPQLAGAAVLLAIGHALWSRYAMAVAAPAVLGLVLAADWLGPRRLPEWRRRVGLAALMALPLAVAPADWGPSATGCPEVGDPPAVGHEPVSAEPTRAPLGNDGYALLTDDGYAALQALGASPSELGPGVTAFATMNEADYFYLRVGVRHDGRWTRFVALRPPLAGAHDVPFVVQRDWGDRDPDVDRFAARLTERLPRWPWASGTPEFRWSLPGAHGRPTTIGRVWASLAFVLLSLLFGVCIVLACPRIDPRASVS
jgi:hypothetical protein